MNLSVCSLLMIHKDGNEDTLIQAIKLKLTSDITTDAVMRKIGTLYSYYETDGSELLWDAENIEQI